MTLIDTILILANVSQMNSLQESVMVFNLELYPDQNTNVETSEIHNYFNFPDFIVHELCKL
jgi:hypothetical protein